MAVVKSDHTTTGGFTAAQENLHATQTNTNTTDIATQTSSIATHTSTIATHTSTIATHTSDIANHTSNIATHTTDIANRVPLGRTVTGTNSITGGGDLSANRTVALVNDSTTPGNSKYYGTNAAGAKGFYDLPVGGGGGGGSFADNGDGTAIVAGVSGAFTDNGDGTATI